MEGQRTHPPGSAHALKISIGLMVNWGSGVTGRVSRRSIRGNVSFSPKTAGGDSTWDIWREEGKEGGREGGREGGKEGRREGESGEEGGGRREEGGGRKEGGERREGGSEGRGTREGGRSRLHLSLTVMS